MNTHSSINIIIINKVQDWWENILKNLINLGARLNLAEGEQYQIAKYISGLRQDIQKVELQSLGRLTKAVTWAKKIEG